MKYKTIIKETLKEDRFFKASKKICKHFQGYTEAIFLSHLMSIEEYFEKQNNLKENGYFYQTIKKIEEILYIKRYKQDNAIKNLKKLGFIKIKKFDIPAKRYFKIDYDRIFEFMNNTESSANKFVGNQQTGLLEINKLDCQNPTNYTKYNKTINNKEYNISKDIYRESKDSVGASKKFIDKIEHPKKRYFDLINSMITYGGFSKHKLPIYSDDPISKTVSRILLYLKEIKSGHFFKTHRWNDKWIQKAGIESIDLAKGKGLSWEDLEKLLLKSCKRYNKMRSSNYGTVDKSKMKNSVADFLYNFQTNTSQFLYYLFNKPLQRDKTITKLIGSKWEKSLQKKIESIFEKYKKPEWGESEEKLFFMSMNSVKKGYEKNKEDLDFYNREENNNSFNRLANSFSLFCDLIDSFYEEANGMFRKSFLDPVNRSPDWKSFVSWLRIEKGVELNVSKKDIESLEKKIKKEELRDYENEIIKISKGLSKIKDPKERRKEAEKLIEKEKRIQDLIPKHKELILEKYKKKGKTIMSKVLEGMAHIAAEEEVECEV
ncbi:MAG: hypothetical protein ACFFDN_04945 [Candidatus Hodarchaeota archaeon]